MHDSITGTAACYAYHGGLNMQQDGFKFDEENEIEVIDIQIEENRREMPDHEESSIASSSNNCGDALLMMTEEIEVDLASNSVKPETLGQRLQAAREALQINVEDAADHLRISPSAIRAIESDNYAYFDNVIFLRGYIRAYAKWLKIPQEEISRAFLQLGLKESTRIDAAVKFNLHQISSRDKPVRLVTYLIIILLVLLMGILGYIHHQGDKAINQPTIRTLTSPPTAMIDAPVSISTATSIKPENTTAMNQSAVNQPSLSTGENRGKSDTSHSGDE